MVVQDVENDPKYRCAECNLQFGTPRDLSRHLNKTARHGGQPSPCAICHKPLTRPDSRARHERRCRERFGVTEEMWQGIERERQRGRRKSISVDSVDEANRLPGDASGGSGGVDSTATGRERGGGGGGSGGGSNSSRSRAASTSEVSDPNDLVAALESAHVASASAPAARFASQPGEPAPWARRRSASLRTPHPHPHPHHSAAAASSPPSSTEDAGMNMNGRKRRESSPHSRRVLPPQARVTSSPTITPSWRPLNRPLSSHYGGGSPPFEPPSSPMAMHDESDGEQMVSTSMYRQPPPVQRWATLPKREGRIAEPVQEGDDDEVDELAGDEDDGPWQPSASHRTQAHHHHLRTQEGMVMSPPPKKKLFGFELDHAGAGGAASWSAHKTQPR